MNKSPKTARAMVSVAAGTDGEVGEGSGAGSRDRAGGPNQDLLSTL